MNGRKLVLGVAAILATVLCTAEQTRALTTTEWVEYGANPVYAPGKAYYPTILKDGGTYTMWSDASSGIQVATSSDGVAWTTVGTATGLSNARHTLVEKIGSQYRMWYWDSSQLYTIAAMRTAVSNDGLTWTGDQALTQVGTTVIGAGMVWNRGTYGPADVFYNPSGSATLVNPTSAASVWANRFVMYYDGTTGGAESIGLAVSNDGVNWQGYNGGLSPVLAGSGGTAWDMDYVSRCTVAFDGTTYHMWYSGGTGSMDDGIGYASSLDGLAWTKDPDAIFAATDGEAWRADRTYCPMVIGDEMWFTGRSAAGAYTIGYAVPEPMTVSLLALGVSGMLIRRGRRSK